MRTLFLSLLVLSLFFFAVAPAWADSSLRVYYAGEAGSVLTALRLGGFTLVADATQADVLLLNGMIPDPAAMAERISQGAGLVLILGPDLSAEEVSSLVGLPLTLTLRSEPLSLVNAGVQDSITTQIVWNSAPQVRERFQVQTSSSSPQPLVVGYETGEWVLWQVRPGVFIFNAFLNEVNSQTQEWAYFNYLIYHLTMRAAGRTPLSFADYPASPVPHDQERNLLWGVMVLMIATTIVVFVVVRRYSLKHPEALDRIVADRARFEVHEAGTEWEEVGFHRPLSGFLVALSLGLVLFIPLIIYQNLVLPGFILPSAQALGIWGRVVQFFTWAWTFFDMGTSVAFIKFLSQYRVNDPRRGIQYGQVFVWWQLLSGAVQVTLVIALASNWVPRSAYALYAWSIIIHAMIQIPGFYQVMRHALNGFQRQDYARMLDVTLSVLMPMVTQPIFVGLMYAWGKNNPAYGGAMGGLLGLGMAAYASELFTFLIGLGLYHRLGYNAQVLFLAHFDWEILKTSLRFGVFEMLGSIAWALGQAAEIAITQARLINYAEIWGNWGLAQNFVFAFNVLNTLFDGSMPAISEAISHGRKVLSQYYSVQMYRWGGTISAFIGAVLLAVADRFILGSLGPEFERGAIYVIPLAIWGAIQYPSWIGDQVALGSNRPYLKFVLVFGEQVLRVVLALILLNRLQIMALIIAYFFALMSKNLAAYFVNHRLCFPQRFYFWPSLASPLLAGVTHYLFLRWLTGLIWQNDQITSVLIFFIGILPSFPLYMFFYGLFGGWDRDTLQELRMAIDLTGFIRPIAWLIWASTALGARLSLLTGRFPITNRQAAMDEARSLTREKVRL